MKSISADLAQHLGLSTTSLCTIWKVTRTDGVVFAATDLDIDLTIDDVTYSAESGYTPTDIETTGALNVDNMEVQGMLNSRSLTEEDLAAGLWDHAAIEIAMVNWADLSQGRLYQRVGTLGEVTLERGTFQAEIRGLMQAYSRVIGELTSPGCRANFGDERCKFPIDTVTFMATVLAVDEDNLSFAFVEDDIGSPPAPAPHDAGYFDYGLATFFTGLNTGRSMEIKTHILENSPETPRIVLQLPMPYRIAVGDTLTLTAGCSKRFEEDCRDRWENTVHFRGEPHVPGNDKIIQVARHGR